MYVVKIHVMGELFGLFCIYVISHLWLRNRTFKQSSHDKRFTIYSRVIIQKKSEEKKIIHWRQIFFCSFRLHFSYNSRMSGPISFTFEPTNNRYNTIKLRTTKVIVLTDRVFCIFISTEHSYMQLLYLRVQNCTPLRSGLKSSICLLCY